MTIAEIIEIESARKEPEQWNVVHLLKEGEFYRAHDWSAWLMSVFPFGEALNKPLHITAKRLKDGYIDAWVGFPATSIGKYIPNDGSVEFLGAYIRPYRVYLSNHTLERIRKKVREFDFSKPWVVVRSINSYLGIFMHTDSYRICRNIFLTKDFLRICIFNREMTKCVDRNIYYQS